MPSKSIDSRNDDDDSLLIGHPTYPHSMLLCIISREGLSEKAQAAYELEETINEEYLRKNWSMSINEVPTEDGLGTRKEMMPKKGSELAKMVFTYTYFSTHQAGLTGSGSYSSSQSNSRELSAQQIKKKQERLTSKAIQAANEATSYVFMEGDDEEKSDQSMQKRLKEAKKVSKD